MQTHSRTNWRLAYFVNYQLLPDFNSVVHAIDLVKTNLKRES